MKSWALFFAAGVATSTIATSLETRATCTNYTNPVTGHATCCDTATSSLTFLNASLGIGICCQFGTILDGLLCVPAPAPPKAGVCSGVASCPQTSGKDLGIKYGTCYVLQGLTLNYLGHDYAAKYEVLGENPGVVFRVCSGQGDCNTKSGTLVGTNQTWYMQDQFGDPTGTGFGWLGGNGGDLSVQDSASDALIVGGSSICYGGQCAVCITFPPGGAHAPCPLNPGQSHLGMAANPNNCQPFFWQEVVCRSEQ